MAEIPIQHKPRRRASVWPWIVGALVVLAIVWGIGAFKRGRASTAAYGDSATSAGEVAPTPATSAPPVANPVNPLDSSRPFTAFDTGALPKRTDSTIPRR
jgi:hypothetical protein